MTLHRGHGGCRASLVALVVGVLFVSACSSDTTSTSSGGPSSGAAGATLTGTSWTLTSYPPSGASSSTPTAAPASLTFAQGGALSGTTGCNSFSGTYTTQASRLSITLGPMTQRACTDPAAQAQESAITQLLPSTATYSTSSSGSLTLQNQTGAAVLVYAAAATGVAGTSWSVTGLNNGRGGVETTALTEALTMSFAKDGSFEAFGGCNQLGGTFTTSGRNGLTIGPLTSTRKTCGDAVDQLESQYTAALGKVATFDINGQVLTLRDSSGATQVTATQSG